MTAAARRAGPGRMLFLEFLSGDPFRDSCAEIFPYLAGYLRGIGVPTAWVAVPKADAAPGQDDYPIRPRAGDVRSLLGTVRRFRPTAILFNVEIGRAVKDALSAAAPGCRVMVVGKQIPRGSDPPLADIHRWISVPSPGGPRGGSGGTLFARAVPDYSCTVLHPERLKVRKQVLVGQDAPCLFQKPIAANPHFRGIETSGLRHESGCSFCISRGARGDPSSAVPSDVAVDRAITQLRRYHETVGPERRSQRFEVSGLRLFQRVRSLATRIGELGLPPSTFCFPRRADEILANADELARSFPIFAAAGHRVVLWCMGVENFSQAENGRFNKGLTCRQAEKALLKIYRWERRWPDVLTFFKEYRGGYLGTILFTPWTTLDDLSANARALRRLSRRIPPLAEVRLQLATRLVIYRRTAIARLAARDGLVADRFEEPFPVKTDELESQEIPWRFRHQKAAMMFRLVIRLAGRRLKPAAPPSSSRLILDELLAGLRAQAEWSRIPFLRLFEVLLEVVGRLPADAAEEEVLAELLRRVSPSLHSWSLTGEGQPPR